MARGSYSRGCVDSPPWMNADEHLFCLGRLIDIRDELFQMGASDVYCRTYFQRDGGFCSSVARGLCKKHRMEQTPLPDGAMCSIEFGHQVSSLRSQVFLLLIIFAFPPAQTDTCFFDEQVAEIKAERNRLNQELERALLLVPASGDGEDQSSSSSPNQARLNEVSELRNELNHLFKQLQELMGKRLALLEQDPVDTVAWHRRVSDLLTEKIELLERLKFGPSPPLPLPAVVEDVAAVGE